MDAPNIDRLRALTKDEASPTNLAHMATIIAIKELSDILERVVIRQDKMEEKVDDIHTRVIRIEENAKSPLSNLNAQKIEVNTKRIDAVEKDLAAWKTRALTIMALGTIAWAVLGDTLQNWIGLIHG